MSHRFLASTFLAISAFALAACNGDGTIAPASTQAATITADLAAQTATDASQNLATVVNSETITGLSMVAATPGAASLTFAVPGSASWTRTCTGPDSQGWYTCGTSKEDGNLDIFRAHRYWKGGTPVPSSGTPYDSIQFRWAEAGVDTADASHRPKDATSLIRWINRGDTSSVGIRTSVTSNQRVWNWSGFRNDSSKTVGSKGTRFYKITGSRVGTNVTYTLPRSANPWPVTGSVTHIWSALAVFTNPGATKSDTTIRSGSTKITFDGTQTPKVVVGGLTCTIDLKTHTTSNCS